jgi:hypothetical protein
MTLGGEPSRGALVRAGVVGRTIPLDVTIAITPSGSTKVSEVVEALCGAPHEHLAVRVALVAGTGSPLDLALHKRVRPVAAAATSTSAH